MLFTCSSNVGLLLSDITIRYTICDGSEGCSCESGTLATTKHPSPWLLSSDKDYRVLLDLSSNVPDLRTCGTNMINTIRLIV